MFSDEVFYDKWNEILEGDNIFIDEIEENFDELELENVGAISSTNYIKWVQRSLNRLLNKKLVVNGKKSFFYREAVKQFNKNFLGARSPRSQVNRKTQNELIKANQMDTIYMFWVQDALRRTGASDIVRTGVKDKSTKIYIQGFQAYRGLMDDGYVGAKTETALIKQSGSLSSWRDNSSFKTKNYKKTSRGNIFK